MRFPNLSLFPFSKKSDDGSEFEYASFTVRTFAISIDMLLLFIFMAPIFGWLSQLIFPEFYLQGGDEKAQAIIMAWGNGQLARDAAMQEMQAMGLFDKMGLDYFLQLFVSGVLIVLSWVKYDTTPGLLMFRCRVADATTGESPTLKRYIIRYVVGVIAIAPFMLGVLMMFFNARKMALHDLAANTVILRRKFRFKREETAEEAPEEIEGEPEIDREKPSGE